MMLVFVIGQSYKMTNNNKKQGDNMQKIIHWTIKVTWQDELGEKYEEYINDYPTWVVKPIDEFVDKLEYEVNESEE